MTVEYDVEARDTRSNYLQEIDSVALLVLQLASMAYFERAIRLAHQRPGSGQVRSSTQALLSLAGCAVCPRPHRVGNVDLKRAADLEDPLRDTFWRWVCDLGNAIRIAIHLPGAKAHH